MANTSDDLPESTQFLDGINSRLGEAAQTGEPLGVMLAVRGRVFPVPGKNRWRIRTARGHVLTFRPEFVVAFDRAGQAPDVIPRRGPPDEPRPARSTSAEPVKVVSAK